MEDKMKTYTVRVPEVHYQYIVVEAEDKESAIAAAKSGEGDYGNDTEYAYTLDSSRFEVLED
jgi:parvulin-like peptidyl-prolyl isomerase